MPLYRFRLTGQDQEKPVELPDDEAAWALILTACNEALAELSEHTSSGSDWEITATDHRGQDVGTIRIVASRRHGPPS